MKNIYNKILLGALAAITIILFAASVTIAGENPSHRTGKVPVPITPSVTVNNIFMQANNINTVMRTDGYFNYDKVTFTSGVAGMVWPVSASSRMTCDFSTGIWIAGLVNGGLRTAVSLYNSVYTPGLIPVSGSVPPTSVCSDSRYKGYHVNLTDPNLKEGGTVVRTAGGRDFTITFDPWSSWPVDQGAPYVEVNGVPGYQPDQGDHPGIGNSDAVPDELVYMVYMDYTNCTNNPHLAEISLPGGTLPLGVEVHQLFFAFNSPGLTNMYFTKYWIINKSNNQWDSTYVSSVNDVDLGNAADDAAGCDSTRSLGFIYNATNNDNIYGTAPPALGSKYLQGPLIHTGNPADSAFLPYDTLVGYVQLGMTGFNVFENTSDVCKGDPDNALAGYNFMKGFDGCGVPTYNWVRHSPSKYKYNGSYCGGLSGWYDSLSTDRRFIEGSGPFTMHAGDTQVVVLGLFIERAGDNIASVCKLINNSSRVQRIYNNNFRSIPLPPPPKVSAVADGDGKITLYWTDTSEYYHQFDKIDLTGYWDFQGYEVYQIKPGTGGENPEDRTLIAVYDKIDTIDNTTTNYHIYDTVDVIQPNGQTMSEVVPQTFGHNSGVSRIITMTANSYPNGSNNFFINGQDYKFAVIAYGCNPNALAPGKVLRNPISAQVLKVTPHYPIMGTNFINKNLDTLVSNRVDRSYLPIVVDPSKVKSATYRMFWRTDTSWSVIRYMNGGVDTVIRNSTSLYSASNDGIVADGVYFKADSINRFKVGVIADPGPGSQTSGYGWTYTGGARNLTGVDTSTLSGIVGGNFVAPQSLSMGLSWPNGSSYKSSFTSRIDTTFIKTYCLKRIKFNFGQTQKAYRYRGAVNNAPYVDMVDVPFTVEMYDPLDTFMTAPRQLNCGFYDYDSSGTWNPKATGNGGLEFVYVFYSNYSETPSPTYTRNIHFLTQFKTMDIMYVWEPRLLNSGAAFTNGDVLTVIPYTIMRHYQTPGYITTADVTTTAPTIGSVDLARDRGELDNIRVVPNPYYGSQAQETSAFDRFVKFTRMPASCNIFIYSLNGNLVRKLVKNDNSTTINWDLLNTDAIPVASGIYIAYIDAPGIGTKIIKLAIFTPEERLDRF